MQVLLDARLGPKPSGIGNYVIQLGTHLPPLVPEGIRVLCRPRHRRLFAQAGGRPVVHIRGSGLPRRLPPFDVFHGPNFHTPAVDPPAVRVATIHDVGYLLLPECHPPGMSERLDALVRASLGGTRMFLCDSQDTADTFAEAYDVESDRLAVTPLAVDSERFASVADATEVRRRLERTHGLSDHYVLFVGAMVPRKDLRTLVRAWALVAEEQPNLELVLAGNKTLRWASDWPHVEAWMHRHPGLAKRVRILDYVPHEDLPTLYQGAAVVMLTSLLEGFGLTVLEAFAAGRPVVATRSSALPEVGGDAAYYGEARDPESFANALRAALAGEGLVQRQELAREIVARHTWDRTARLTVDAYRRAIDDGLG
jgi:alpha-1,3-rhamnosyl/mannosyltransferase